MNGLWQPMAPSRREGHQLMEDSIAQIQDEVERYTLQNISSMRDKYRVATSPQHAGRSQSFSPVFSPGDSPPPAGTSDWAATPKPAALKEDRRSLLRSRPVAVRSVVGNSYSPPPPPPLSTVEPSSRTTVAFSSSDDDTSSAEEPAAYAWARDETPPPRPPSAPAASRSSRHADWSASMPAGTRSSAARSPTGASRSHAFPAGHAVSSLSSTPPSLLDEANMHRMVSRLEELFGKEAVQDRLQLGGTDDGSIGSPRTPVSAAHAGGSSSSSYRAETRYETLERLAAEKSTATARRRQLESPPAAASPTMRMPPGGDSAFLDAAPPYGEAYSPYSKRTTWARPASPTDAAAEDYAIPTLRAQTASNSGRKKKPAPAGADRPYPYAGATTWRETCRVRGSLARFPLFQAPLPGSTKVGSIRNGQHVEVLRTDIGSACGSQAECAAMWVLLAQGGWLRVSSSVCSSSYGEWLAQGGNGERREVAVLQRVQRPGKGMEPAAGGGGSGRSGQRGSRGGDRRPSRRPFYT
jgi:hypothetical protein